MPETSSTTDSGQKQTQVTPKYTAIQQALIDKWMGDLTSVPDSGTYSTMKAVESDPNKIFDYLLANKGKIKDPEIAKMLEDVKPDTSNSLNPFDRENGWEKKFNDYRRDVARKDVIRYIQDNPGSLISMGIGQKGSDWEKAGNKVYAPPKFEDSPLAKQLKASEDYSAEPYRRALGIGKDAPSNYRQTTSSSYAKAAGGKRLLDSISYGVDSNGKRIFDPDHPEAVQKQPDQPSLQNVHDQHVADRASGKYENQVAEENARSVGAVEALQTGYTDTLKNIDSEYEKGLAGIAAKYGLDLDEVRNIIKPQDVTYRDGTIPFTSRKSIEIGRLLSDLADKEYGAGADTTDKTYSAKRGTAGDTRAANLSTEQHRAGRNRESIDTDFTSKAATADMYLDYLEKAKPGQSAIDYLNTIAGTAAGQQQFGLSTGVTNSSGSSTSSTSGPGASFLDTALTVAGGIAGGIDNVKKIAGLF
jgi:hypothetical protein